MVVDEDVGVVGEECFGDVVVDVFRFIGDDD